MNTSKLTFNDFLALKLNLIQVKWSKKKGLLKLIHTREFLCRGFFNPWQSRKKCSNFHPEGGIESMGCKNGQLFDAHWTEKFWPKKNTFFDIYEELVDYWDSVLQENEKITQKSVRNLKVT